MPNQQSISADLLSALVGTKPLSTELYADALADHEANLAVSLDRDADDALLCMLADKGQVAMMLIDWDGTVYRNEAALQKLRAMWPHTLEANAKVLVPVFCEHISQRNLGVAGIKWTVQKTN